MKLKVNNTNLSFIIKPEQILVKLTTKAVTILDIWFGGSRHDSSSFCGPNICRNI